MKKKGAAVNHKSVDPPNEWVCGELVHSPREKTAGPVKVSNRYFVVFVCISFRGFDFPPGPSCMSHHFSAEQSFPFSPRFACSSPRA